MTYNETKKVLDTIRSSNEIIFRFAISHLLDVGIRNLTEENVNECCAEIMKQDDSKSFMTNEFQCELVRMAGELARLDHIHLLVYISREIYYDVGDNHITYNRAIDIIQNCISWIISGAECEDAYNDLIGCGFDSEELKVLGYGDLVDFTEEEEEYEHI